MRDAPREGPPSEDTRLELAVQRTLSGVRSRAGTFGKSSESARARGRGSDEKEDALSLMRDLGQVALLTAAEEGELARQIQVRRDVLAC